MAKAPVKVNEHFVVKASDGSEAQVIYNPPLLAESQNIRVELRKEKKHDRPHIHIIKKGKENFYDVSVALDDLSILAGGENVSKFNEREWDVMGDFLFNNQKLFIKLYSTLKGEL